MATALSSAEGAPPVPSNVKAILLFQTHWQDRPAPLFDCSLAGVRSGESDVCAEGNDARLCVQRDRKPAIREGPQYQARVPDGPPRPRPGGSEEDDPRAGTRGPTPEEMLAIAAGPEKEAASALPPDARTDDDNVANVNGVLPVCQLDCVPLES